jgi:hypothetical protein
MINPAINNIIYKTENESLLKFIIDDAEPEIKAKIVTCRLLKGSILIGVDKNTLDYRQSIRHYKVNFEIATPINNEEHNTRICQFATYIEAKLIESLGVDLFLDKIRIQF